MGRPGLLLWLGENWILPRSVCFSGMPAEPAPVCEACGDLVDPRSDGCTAGEIICDGEVYDRIKVGDEADIFTELTQDQRCSGCFSNVGFFPPLRLRV